MPNVPISPERVAHRGASRERRENTLPAFQLALERGADAIELDVHATADGVVVVHHDPAVGAHAIADTVWTELAGLALPGRAHIPKLKDVLTTVGGRATVYIELKGAGCEARAIAVAREFGQRYAVHSFDLGAIERAAALAPDVPRGVLIDRGTPRAARTLVETARRLKPRDVWPHHSLVDAAFATAAAALGLRVIVWTVNEPAEARRLTALGVAGICTDDVRLLANL
jgi:glycerophosphoryl diester phosphodiesterase